MAPAGACTVEVRGPPAGERDNHLEKTDIHRKDSQVWCKETRAWVSYCWLAQRLYERTSQHIEAVGGSSNAYPLLRQPRQQLLA